MFFWRLEHLGWRTSCSYLTLKHRDSPTWVGLHMQSWQILYLKTDSQRLLRFHLFTNGVHSRYNIIPPTKAFSGIFMIVTSDCDLPDKLIARIGFNCKMYNLYREPAIKFTLGLAVDRKPFHKFSFKVFWCWERSSLHLKDEPLVNEKHKDFAEEYRVWGGGLVTFFYADYEEWSPWYYRVNNCSAITNHEDPTGPGCLSLIIQTQIQIQIQIQTQILGKDGGKISSMPQREWVLVAQHLVEVELGNSNPQMLKLTQKLLQDIGKINNLGRVGMAYNCFKHKCCDGWVDHRSVEKRVEVKEEETKSRKYLVTPPWARRWISLSVAYLWSEYQHLSFEQQLLCLECEVLFWWCPWWWRWWGWWWREG